MQDNPRSFRTHNDYAFAMRKAVVVVGSDGSVPDCNLSAIEREFPWVTVERAVTMDEACVKFDHPCR